MDISSVLDGLDKSEEPANENPIVKELNQLDHRSFEMARLIAQSNKERSDLREEVLEIINRLDSLAEKIETEQPGLYDKVADQISESLLDLSYVELETDMLSLRLGEFLRNSNSLNQTTASEQTTTGQTQMIQSKEGSKIKKAVYHFLMHVIGVDLPESDTFISMLPEPIQDFDEVRGTFWQLKTPFAKIRIIPGDPPTVIRFWSHKAIPGERIRPLRPGGYSKSEAIEVALDFAHILMPDFDKRNFILETENEVDSYYFKWYERPAGKVISVPPNRVSIHLNRESLRLELFSMFDFHSWRTKPPRITREEAESKARKVWQGKGSVHEVRLWERIRNGGKEIRTVWSVALTFPNPEGEALEEVVIDADTGEIIEGQSF